MDMVSSSSASQSEGKLELGGERSGEGVNGCSEGGWPFLVIIACVQGRSSNPFQPRLRDGAWLWQGEKGK